MPAHKAFFTLTLLLHFVLGVLYGTSTLAPYHTYVVYPQASRSTPQQIPPHINGQTPQQNHHNHLPTNTKYFLYLPRLNNRFLGSDLSNLPNTFTPQYQSTYGSIIRIPSADIPSHPSYPHPSNFSTVPTYPHTRTHASAEGK